MEEVEFECKNLIEYLKVYRELLNNIPYNTRNIIDGISEKLNELCLSKMINFSYDDNSLIITYTGNFASIEQSSDYDNELYELIGEHLGDYNYGGNGVFEAKVKNVSFDGGVYNSNYSTLIVEVMISSYANPVYLKKLLKK